MRLACRCRDRRKRLIDGLLCRSVLRAFCVRECGGAAWNAPPPLTLSRARVARGEEAPALIHSCADADAVSANADSQKAIASTAMRIISRRRPRLAFLFRESTRTFILFAPRHPHEIYILGCGTAAPWRRFARDVSRALRAHCECGESECEAGAAAASAKKKKVASTRRDDAQRAATTSLGARAMSARKRDRKRARNIS